MDLNLQVTPFLLKRLGELTKGKSQKANVSLVLNNARVGAKVAVALAAAKPSTAGL